MKLLQKEYYKGHTIEIYGEYSEESYNIVTIDEKEYGGCVYTKYIIHKPKGTKKEVKFDMNKVFMEYHPERVRKYIASNKVGVEGKIFRKKKRHITLKEDLQRIIKDHVFNCKATIDGWLLDAEQKEREQNITNGLIDSLDNIKPKKIK